VSPYYLRGGVRMAIGTLATGMLLGTSACGGLLNVQAPAGGVSNAQVVSSSGAKEPAPGPSPSTNAPPPVAGDTVPERKVQPSYDVKQSEQEMDRILAGGQPHNITVLFKDEYKIRIRQGQGTVRDANCRGFVALSDAGGILAAINGVLGKYQFKSFIAHLSADTKTEAELEAREKDDEAKAGHEFPNDGSWATLVMESYTAAKAKELALALQKLPSVRMADVVDNPSTGN